MRATGADKVAAEQVLLGAPVTVTRPGKIHGQAAARRGQGVDQPTAAANIAADIEVVAAKPGQRILHSADPDAPSALEISHTIARLLGHAWREVLLDDNPAPLLGRHPWDVPHPIVLDMSAATRLGYAPAGDYASEDRYLRRTA